MIQVIRNIGPGAMVAAAFIGPGTVTTATMAGSSYGYTLVWAVVFSTVATIILQDMSGRLGVAGQIGVGEALRLKIKHKVIWILVAILVVSALFIGNAAYEAGNLTGAVLGFQNNSSPGTIFIPGLLGIAAFSFVLLMSGAYKWIEKTLIALVCLMGIVFIAAAIMVKPDLVALGQDLFVPSLPENAIMMVLGLMGTTVVPYNLFLHASAAKRKWPDRHDVSPCRWDTVISVVTGGAITLTIMITSAGAAGLTGGKIENMTDLSRQLEPVLGSGARTFMAFGFLAAGLSSAITAPLAAALATSEVFNWPGDMKGHRFRMTWMLVLASGVVVSTLGVKPTKLILFAQVANGILLPVIAVCLMWIMNDSRIMGSYKNSILTNVLGVAVILVAIILGAKGVVTAVGLL